MNDTVPNNPDKVDPPTARLMWLRLALLIADGAPEPRTINVNVFDRGLGVEVRFADGDRASVEHWAPLLELPPPSLSRPMHSGRWFAEYGCEAVSHMGPVWLGCYYVRLGVLVDAAEPTEPAALSPVEADAVALLRRAVAE